MSEYPRLPARVEVGRQSYFLVGDAASYRLLSTTCPHQGGVVYDQGERFTCPLHNWQFAHDGRCLTAPGRALPSYPVALEDGILFAELPPASDAPAARRLPRCPPGLRVHVHGHACLEIAWGGHSLVTDPWLDGPAMLGAWAPYPPPLVSGRDLRPTALLITHEHSDHFHVATLRQFDRSTPVFVPDFPNQRLPQRLRTLGFVQVHPLRFGERTEIAPGWALTAYEPDSFWNDALVLIDVAGFRLLNLNDAGINARLADALRPVDLLAVQFSAGASGYPWTWAGIPPERQREISERSCKGTLALVREAARLYDAARVLPFASHFTLWHPSHAGIARQMRRNRPSDVADALAGTGVRILDLLPGDHWCADHDRVTRARDPETVYEASEIEAYIAAGVPEPAFAEAHPQGGAVSRDQVQAYFMRLNDVSEIAHCEDLCVRLAATGDVESLALDFEVRDGRLRMLDRPTGKPHLSIELPMPVLAAIVQDDLSWDEAFIGCWCRFDRDPDVYHAGFWRLLQAPALGRAPRLSRPVARTDIGVGSAVADVLEVHGAEADRILRRYGLYCSACHHSTADTIEQAGRQHGLAPARVAQLVAELRQALLPGPA